MEPQGLSNVVWALGKMDTSGVHGLHHALDAIMDAVLTKVCTHTRVHCLYSMCALSVWHPYQQTTNS